MGKERLNRVKYYFDTSPCKNAYILLFGVIVLNIIMQGLNFFSLFNINSIFAVNTPLIIAAIAQTIVVLSGGVDLSIGSNITLVNVLSIVLYNDFGWSIMASWGAALLAAALVGLFNGILAGYFRIPPLLATFATMSIVGGLALWVLPNPGGLVPRAVYSTYGDYTLGLPTTLWIIALVVVIWLVINKFPLGKYIRAVGGNERYAYSATISVLKVKLITYTFSGFITGIAGLCLTAFTASGDPRIGASLGLQSVAAVIIGGSKLSGGWGKIEGSIMGALFLGLTSNMVFFLFYKYMDFLPAGSISSFLQELLASLIIILGLASAKFTQSRKLTY